MNQCYLYETFPCKLLKLGDDLHWKKNIGFGKVSGNEHFPRIVLALLQMPYFIAHIIFRGSKRAFCDLFEFDWRVNKIRTMRIKQEHL